MSILSFLFVNIVIGLACAGNPDKVNFLPGVNFSLPFKHYAGYLEALNSNQLFYWFFESQNDPVKDPVLLWLNGGPGCSSLFGALTENGPLTLVSKNSLKLNPFAWNNRASVLYLESPAEVGFSYNPTHNISTNDDLAAENNLAALKSFFDKFPYLKKNEFYITGESYAGVYIPTLSLLMHHNKFPINFRGFAIGNGLLSEKLNENSLYQFYAHHGFLDDKQWRTLVGSCCSNPTDIRHCGIKQNQNQQCITARTKADLVVSNLKFKDSNIYGKNEDKKKSNTDIYKEQFSQTELDEVSDLTVEDYLNREDVKQALHIRAASLAKWNFCNKPLFKAYQRIYSDMSIQIKQLLQSGLKGLIYNGNFDSVCNFVGDMWFCEELGFGTVQENHAWIVNDTEELGGFVKQYKHFYYVTVLGAGHFVPTDKPKAAQDMIYKFLIDA